MTRTIRFFAMLISLCLIAAAARAESPDLEPGEYWHLAQKAAKAKFDRFNIELTLNTGYNFASGDNRGIYTGVSVPIYSKKDRISSDKEAIAFLKQCSEAIGNLDQALSILIIQQDAIKFYEARLSEDGTEGAKAYFDQRQQIAKQQALIRQYHRDIKALINPMAESIKQAKQ